jgi:hypothetical protein
MREGLSYIMDNRRVELAQQSREMFASSSLSFEESVPSCQYLGLIKNFVKELYLNFPGCPSNKNNIANYAFFALFSLLSQLFQD